MATIMHGFMAYDPVERHGFLSSVGQTETEAGVNLSAIELTDEVTERIIFVQVDVMYDSPDSGE